MATITRRTRAIRFHSTSLHIVRRDGEVWLRGPQIADALGYRSSRQRIEQLYRQHAAEFTDRMTQLLKLPTPGGEQEVRVFSLRGAHLLAMFARTERAAEFRKWVLDVLDATPAPATAISAPAAAPRALPQPPAPAHALAQPAGPSLANTTWLMRYDHESRPTMRQVSDRAVIGTPHEMAEAVAQGGWGLDATVEMLEACSRHLAHHARRIAEQRRAADATVRNPRTGGQP